MEKNPKTKTKIPGNKILIFVLNVGRSGSKSVAEGFGLAHEPDAYKPSIPKLKKRAKGKPRYGETSHFWKHHLKELTSEFPNALYIHLVRNGKDVVKSYLDRPWWYSSLAQYPYQAETLPIHGWDSFNRVEKLCHYWRFYNKKIDKHADFRVKLEQISHLLPHKNKGPHKYSFSEKEKKTFNHICGDLNQKYGY